MVDEALGGYIAARHLLDRGARRLAYVAGPLEHSAIRRRLSGARRAAEEVGVPLEVVAAPDLQLGSGRQAGRSVLAAGTVDGIVCASDPLAIGLIDAAGELGLAVPEDLLVVGYDDNHLAAESAVPVSSISQRGGHLAERPSACCWTNSTTRGRMSTGSSRSRPIWSPAGAACGDRRALPASCDGAPLT